MKLAILTSNQLRHKYFIDFLSRVFDVSLVIMEGKKRDPSKKGEGTDLDTEVKRYFSDREQSEKDFFGAVDFSQTEKRVGLILNAEPGQLNVPEVVSALKSASPDFLAVFGSSIIGDEIINLFPGRIINLHLGLSPYYRGSGTNFWPLYEEKLEYVGATIHYLDKGVDTGKIIIQGRPDIGLEDTPHSIGNKTIIRGAALMAETLKRLSGGENIPGEVQDLSIGRQYYFKDCTPEHIITLEKKFANGLVARYLERVSGVNFHERQ